LTVNDRSLRDISIPLPALQNGSVKRFLVIM